MLDSFIQVLGGAVVAILTGATAYQVRSNKAQDDRLGRMELEIPVLRRDLINFNDVILAQFSNLNDKMSDLQEQRREHTQQLDIRLNHLDSLLAGLYLVYVNDRDSKEQDEKTSKHIDQGC